MARRVLIAGCGYLGEALARRLLARGDEVVGLRRDPSGLDPRVEPVAADVTDARTLAQLPSADALVYAVGAGARHEGAYRGAYVEGVRNVLEALARGPGLPARTLFVSSTAVYAQDDDGWVDEDSEAAPTSATAKILLEAEALAARARGAKILRLSGLYGPGRRHLIRTVDEGEAIARDVYTNRIHRDDAARALELLLDADPDAGPGARLGLFIGTDDEPARLSEVRAFIAELLTRERGAPPPAAGASPGRGRAGATSKRLRNARLRSLGFVPEYSSYRDGYPEIVRGYLGLAGS